jgi:hypothetical protein
MKNSLRTVALAAVISATTTAFAPVSLSGRAINSACHKKTFISNDRLCQLNASKDDNESKTRASRTHSLKSILQRKSKPVTFAIATASTVLSCLPGQSLFKPLQAQASAPIVLRAAKTKDEPPMAQAMTKAKQLKKQRSLEEFDALMQKLNDIEDAQGKKARDAYEKQYQIDKAAKEAQKAVDLENLKRNLLDEGKDPHTFLDAEREVFLFEHDVDLEKIPGTPHNEQMIKNFRSRGKIAPTYESQRYIVKCQVEDLKARGVDPLEHFSQQEVIDKTRAIYYMDDKTADKVAEQYKSLMDKYDGRLTLAQEGEVPFVRPGSGEPQSVKEKRAVEKAAARAKRVSEKAAKKQARADAKARAKADKMAAKGRGASAVKMAEPVVIQTTEVALVEETIPQKETTTVSRSSKKKKGSKFSIASLTKKVSPKQAAIVVVGGGTAVLGYRLYSEVSVTKRNEQYKSIMGGGDDDDDDDFDDDFDDEDDDDDDDDY